MANEMCICALDGGRVCMRQYRHDGERKKGHDWAGCEMSALTILSAIETRCLLVREIVLDDAAGFARYMTRRQYQRFLAVRYPNVYAVKSFVTRAVARQEQRGRVCYQLAAQCKREGVVRGDGFIHFHEPGVAELGWGIDPRHWGKGLGGELAVALVAIAIEKLGAETVWCKVMEGNEASARVACKAGLVRDRVVPAASARMANGLDVAVYTASAEDYFDQPY